jgi:DNA-binding protein H-NS
MSQLQLIDNGEAPSTITAPKTASKTKGVAMSETLEQLRKQQADIATKILKAEAEAKTTAISKIQQILTDSGMSNADLHAAFPVKDNTKPKATRAKAKPKYVDPNNAANTWVGRGALPRWIKDSGKDKSAFLIK